MTLLRQVSDRYDRQGKPFDNLFLCWRFEGKVYYMRVRPQFKKEYGILRQMAREVPKGDMLAKYVD